MTITRITVKGATMERVLRINSRGHITKCCSICTKPDNNLCVTNTLWQSLGFSDKDLVCLTCVSKKLGRPLGPGDFNDYFPEWHRWNWDERIRNLEKRGVLSGVCPPERVPRAVCEDAWHQRYLSWFMREITEQFQGSL